MRAALEVLERGYRQNDFEIESFESVITSFCSKLREKFLLNKLIYFSFFINQKNSMQENSMQTVFGFLD